MKDKSFQFGIFLFCIWRMYYNFVAIVPKWLNDSYFVIESFLVVIFIYSSQANKSFRIIGLYGSIGSFVYFLMQYLGIFVFDQVGAKYFVPTFITIGIIIATNRWRRYH